MDEIVKRFRDVVIRNEWEDDLQFWFMNENEKFLFRVNQGMVNLLYSALGLLSLYAI